MSNAELKLYGELAEWWPLLSAPEEYAEEAAFYSAALFAPDAVTETYRASTDHGGHDGDGRALRFLEWSWDPDPSDTTCIADYIVAVREQDGSVRIVHDRQLEGVFPRDTWLRLLRAAGFEPEVVPFDHSELEPGTYQVFLARKPGR
jgi:hypothetical protein